MGYVHWNDKDGRDWSVIIAKGQLESDAAELPVHH